VQCSRINVREIDLNIGTTFLCNVVALMYLGLRKFQKGVSIYGLLLSDQFEICKYSSYTA
jgi:hypothetical protein